MEHALLPTFLFFVLSFFPFSLGALRPRGVSLQNKVFYDPTQQFYCLDGSGIFPFYYVNDDFCDCKDGTDEPGTSACRNGIFNCLNHGSVPLKLPSSRVNDGICDCCDSSDEYKSKADCFNNCKELGEKATAEAKLYQEEFLKGHAIRDEYIKLGKGKIEEYKELLEELLQQEQEALNAKDDKQDEKDVAETQESAILTREKEFKLAQQKRIAAEKRLLVEHQQQDEAEGQKAFSELDLDKNGKLTAKEIQSFKRFDYDGDGKVSDNEAQFYMHKKEEMSLPDFLSNGWRIMKPAYTIEEAEDSPAQQQIIEKSRKKPVDKAEDISPPTSPDEKDNILKDAAYARKNYADAEKLYRDIQAEIWHLRRKLDSDFGENSEFLVLEGQCFEFSDKRYLYKLCPFDKVTQTVKVNQDETLLGLWDAWKGPKENHYMEMKYSRGTPCWNGPNRSADVKVKCGTENKVTSVTEVSPCTYVFEFITPAFCKILPPEISRILKNDWNIV